MELEGKGVSLLPKLRNLALMIAGVYVMTAVIHFLVSPPAERWVGVICGGLVGGTCAYKRWI